MRLIGSLVAAFFGIMIGCSLISNHGVNARGLLLSGAPSSGGGGGGCSQAATFVARAVAADATFDSTHQTAITNYICYLVGNSHVITGDLSTTGCGTKLDVLYVEATQSVAVAKLNLCGTSHTLGVAGAGTFGIDYHFTADTGIDVNDSSAFFIDPGINLSTFGGNYVLDSAHLSQWIMSSDGPLGNATMGANDGTSISYIVPEYPGLGFLARVNDGANLAITNTGPGYYVVNRTGSTTRTVYKNGSSIGSDSQVSTSIPNIALYSTSSWNNNGGGTGAGRIVGMESIGVGLTSGEITDLRTAGCAYLLAVTGSTGVGC